MYTVCVLLGSLDVMEKKAVFYAIALKNMLFLIFCNTICIVLKYCFCKQVKQYQNKVKDETKK